MTQAEILENPETRTHILVVDDDERLRLLLRQYLTENGFLVTTADSAIQAREVLKHLTYDLMILDVMMPGEDGMSLTRALKKEGAAIPILLLTALGEIDSRIEGLEAGADDYLPKPFEPRELLLRINAIMRRIAAAAPTEKTGEIRFGQWILDTVRGEMRTETGERQMLTQVEQTLIRALAGKVGQVVNREELCALCGIDAAERTIDVQVTRLRKKLEEDPKLPKYLQTVRGKGYVLWSD